MNIKKIIVHHTAHDADTTYEQVDQWHREFGWKGFGYNALIRWDGSIQYGRPENTPGAHAGPEWNRRSLGVALSGNFEVREPKEAQIRSLVEYCLVRLDRYGLEPEDIIGHKDVRATLCPGRLMDMDALRERVRDAGRSIYRFALGDTGYRVEALQDLLIMCDHAIERTGVFDAATKEAVSLLVRKG